MNENKIAISKLYGERIETEKILFKNGMYMQQNRNTREKNVQRFRNLFEKTSILNRNFLSEREEYARNNSPATIVIKHIVEAAVQSQIFRAKVNEASPAKLSAILWTAINFCIRLSISGASDLFGLLAIRFSSAFSIPSAKAGDASVIKFIVSK